MCVCFTLSKLIRLHYGIVLLFCSQTLLITILAAVHTGGSDFNYGRRVLFKKGVTFKLGVVGYFVIF